MIFHPTHLEDAFLIDVERHADERGFLARTFCEREFADHGLPMRIVQSSTIHSPRCHTLRGLHYQEAPHARDQAGALHARIDLPRDGRPAAGLADPQRAGSASS